MTYAEKLKNPRWQKKRLQILDRDKFTCTLCGDTETTLHVHHNKYEGEPWEAEDAELKTHCEHCHLIIESFKKSEVDEKVKRVVKIVSKNPDINFMILMAVCDFDKGRDLYYLFDYYPEDKKLEYQYVISSNVFAELNYKLTNAKD